MIRLRIFVGGQVRHSSMIEPERLAWAVRVIRDNFQRLVGWPHYVVVGDYENLTTILWRQ